LSPFGVLFSTTIHHFSTWEGHNAIPKQDLFAKIFYVKVIIGFSVFGHCLKCYLNNNIPDFSDESSTMEYPYDSIAFQLYISPMELLQ